MDEERDVPEGGTAETETDVDRRAKRMAPTRILQVLTRHSDKDHPLTQEEIIEFLKRDFGMPIKRKAVGYSVALLRDSGFDIRQTDIARGVYLASHEFDDDELRLLADGLLSGGRLPEDEARGLIERLGGLSGAYFDSLTEYVTPVADRPQEDGADELFADMKILDDAIGEGRKVRFCLREYGPGRVLMTVSEHTASPYGIILYDRRYYIVAFDDAAGKMLRFRLDRMSGLKKLRALAVPLGTVPGYGDGIDYADEAKSLPCPERDETDEIELLVDAGALDGAVERFGTDIDVRDEGDGRYRVYVSASPSAAERWAMEHLDCVEVVAPASLRQRMARTLSRAAERYSPKKKSRGGPGA